MNVSATKIKIALNQSTTLTCSVTRSNPSNPTFKWNLTNTNNVVTTLTGETGETLQLSNIAEGQFGTYSCTATNSARQSGIASVTIDQGCKQLDSISHLITCSSFCDRDRTLCYIHGNYHPIKLVK